MDYERKSKLLSEIPDPLIYTYLLDCLNQDDFRVYLDLETNESVGRRDIIEEVKKRIYNKLRPKTAPKAEEARETTIEETATKEKPVEHMLKKLCDEDFFKLFKSVGVSYKSVHVGVMNGKITYANFSDFVKEAKKRQDDSNHYISILLKKAENDEKKEVENKNPFSYLQEAINWHDARNKEELENIRKPFVEPFKEEPNEHTCKDCRYFVEFNDDSPLEECRRFPPVLDRDGDFAFADTHSNNWCGEFKAKGKK